MHIVLDLDETLIYTQMHKPSATKCDFKFTIAGSTYYVSKRPGLDNFLNFVFGHFESVSVWTAATEEYAKIIMQHIFTNEQRNSLLFIKTRADNHISLLYPLYKPLLVLFKDNKAKAIKMRASNTIMIDDREEVMSANYGNGFLVPPYNGNKTDIVLYQLVIVLRIILDKGFRMGNFDRVLKLSDILGESPAK